MPTSWYLWKALIEFRCTDSRLFGATVWKNLLIIEPFSQQKLKKKSTLKTVLEYGGILGVVGKPLASQI
jgi:hypothetical protein